MKLINTSRPFKVAAVVLRSGEILADKIIMLSDNFIVVFTGEDDSAPTWYNITEVLRLDRVEVYSPSPAPRKSHGITPGPWV